MQIVWRAAVVALWVSGAPGSWAQLPESWGQQHPKARMVPGEYYLPPPAWTQGEVLPPGQCGAHVSDDKSVQQRLYVLGEWAKLHFKPPPVCDCPHAPGRQCVYWNQVVAKWQQTVGLPVTGRASVAEIQALDAALAARKADIDRDTAALPAMLASRGARQNRSAAPRDPVDLLPGGSDPDAPGSCRKRFEPVEAAIVRELSIHDAKSMALGGETLRRAYMQEQRQRLLAPTQAVAPAWKALWDSEPLLTAWIAKRQCQRVPLRYVVEDWQEQLQLPIDAMDVQGLPKTREILAKANDEAARLNQDLAKRLEAEAAARGDDQLVRRFDLSAGLGRSSMEDMLAKLPASWCVRQGEEIACAKPAVCAAERAVAKNPPANMARPMVSGKSLAQLELEGCLARAVHQPAMRSTVSFGGQEITKAHLLFGPKGLMTLQAQVADGSAAAARAAVNGWLGLPQPQEVTRTEERTVMLPGEMVAVPGVGSVLGPMEMESVPVSRSYTKYVWRGPGVLAEELLGRFALQFDTR